MTMLLCLIGFAFIAAAILGGELRVGDWQFSRIESAKRRAGLGAVGATVLLCLALFSLWKPSSASAERNSNPAIESRIVSPAEAYRFRKFLDVNDAKEVDLDVIIDPEVIPAQCDATMCIRMNPATDSTLMLIDIKGAREPYRPGRILGRYTITRTGQDTHGRRQFYSLHSAD